MNELMKRPVPAWIKPVLLTVALAIAAAPALYELYGFLETSGYFDPDITDCCAPEA